MLEDEEHVHGESEYNAEKTGMSPDPEKQLKKNDLSDSDGRSTDEEQRMASLKRVFKKAFIYSIVFTVIVTIIGEFLYPSVIFRRRFVTLSAVADVFLALCI